MCKYCAIVLSTDQNSKPFANCQLRTRRFPRLAYKRETLDSCVPHPLQNIIIPSFPKHTLEQPKMPLKLLDATVSSFESVFEKFRSEAPQNKANLILFLADKDPSTSLSWCPGNTYIVFFAHDRNLAIFFRFIVANCLWVFGVLSRCIDY